MYMYMYEMYMYMYTSSSLSIGQDSSIESSHQLTHYLSGTDIIYTFLTTVMEDLIYM